MKKIHKKKTLFFILIFFILYINLYSQSETYFFTIPSNGIKVHIIPDYNLPLAGLSIFYRGGASEEPKNKRGITNVIKYLMFMRTENLASDEFLFFFFNIGGKVDAQLSEKYIIFYEVFPAVYINSVLWLEQERMRGLKFGVSDVERAKKLAISEVKIKNSEILSKIYIKIDLSISGGNNQFATPAWGRSEDIKKISLNDVKKYYRKHFTLNKPTVIVTGPFNSKNLAKKIFAYFSKIRRPSIKPSNNYPFLNRAEGPFRINPINKTYIYSKVFILPLPKTLKEYLIYELLTKTFSLSLNGDIMKKLPAFSKFDVKIRYTKNNAIIYTVLYSKDKLKVFKSKYILDNTLKELVSKRISDEAFKTLVNTLLSNLLWKFQFREERLKEIANYYSITNKILLKEQFYYSLLRINKFDLYREANNLLKNKGIKIETK